MTVNWKAKDIGGAKAAKSGRACENEVEVLLRHVAKLSPNETARSLETIIDNHQKTLFGDMDVYPETHGEKIGMYKRELYVPLAGFHDESEEKIRVDFAMQKFTDDEPTLLSVKFQASSGSADTKLFEESFDVIETGKPGAIYVCGNGYRNRILAKTWRRVRHYGQKILLFRTEASFIKWLRAGFPSRGKGSVTFHDIFNEFCDPDPCITTKE